MHLEKSYYVGFYGVWICGYIPVANTCLDGLSKVRLKDIIRYFMLFHNPINRWLQVILRTPLWSELQHVWPGGDFLSINEYKWMAWFHFSLSSHTEITSRSLGTDNRAGFFFYVSSLHPWSLFILNKEHPPKKTEKKWKPSYPFIFLKNITIS